MPKRSNQDTRMLAQKAFRLLEDGLSVEEIAKQLKTSTRTIQRWLKDDKLNTPEVRTQVQLAVLSVNESPINHTQDIENYHKSQQWLALEMGGLAAKLLPLLKESLEDVRPQDISPRMIPSLLKTVSELATASSDAWARATGLEQVHQ